jgi:phage anti-repressor protein
MANEIVRQDVQVLVDGWMEAEHDGVAFPVPLHEYWGIAGHQNKQDAFKLAESLLEEGFDYLGSTLKNKPGRGRGVKAMHLTLAGLEHLCLAAHTDQGKQVRELYRISKRNWDEVKRRNPAIAQEIELERLKNEGRSLDNEGKAIDLKIVHFRHIVTTTMPTPIADKILGCKEIPVVEYRDRIIHNDDLINDGSTVLKTDLCHRYSILTRNGKPDYKRLNQVLDQLPKDAFTLSVRIQDNYELRRDYLPELDKIVDSTDRNRWIGE